MSAEERQVKPAERAYNGIRDAILSGELKPGEHLREEPLAALTDTSRTPVREALRRLVSDGLAVERNRHRFVAEFTATEIAVMYDLRARVESYAAALAAQHIDRAGLDRLEELVVGMDAIDPEGGQASIDAFRYQNALFHDVIIASTGSVQLDRLVRPVLMAPASLIKQHVLNQTVAIRESNAQHKEICRALAARSSDWAEAAMKAHVLSTRPRVSL